MLKLSKELINSTDDNKPIARPKDDRSKEYLFKHKNDNLIIFGSSRIY